MPHCGAHVAHARARHWLGATASPGRYINTGATLSGRPCDRALQVPAVLADLQRMVPQIPFIDRMLAFFSCFTETGLTVQTVQKTCIPCAVLGRCRHARWCANDRLWF